MRSQWNRCSAGTFLILLLPSLCAIAQTQQPPATVEATKNARTGFITGKVVNESGQPLPHASVQVRVGDTRGINQTTTNRDGVFKISGREGVSYSIAAFMPAHTPKPREPGDGPPPQYRVGDSVTLVLIKGGVVTGTVTTSNGEPVVALPVRVWMVRDHNGRSIAPRTGLTREGVTDDRGVYRIYGLPTGTYIAVTDSAQDYSGTGVNAFASDIPTYAPA